VEVLYQEIDGLRVGLLPDLVGGKTDHRCVIALGEYLD
jgi:hypothetical protein